MATQDDNNNKMIERVIKLESKVESLEKNHEKLDDKLDRLFDKLEEIQQFMIAQKGGWKLATIIGAVVVGVATISKLFIDFLKP